MLGVSSAGLEARYLFSGKGAVSCQPGATPGQRPGATPWATPQYPSSVPLASCRHNETMRDANNTPNQSVAADVSRLKLDPRPARNGRLRNRSDPAHAGCYKAGMEVDQSHRPRCHRRQHDWRRLQANAKQILGFSPRREAAKTGRRGATHERLDSLQMRREEKRTPGPLGRGLHGQGPVSRWTTPWYAVKIL